MQNVHPKKGGGGNIKSPVTGGGDRNKTPGNPRSAKSAPSERPQVRSGSTPRKVQTGGQTSVKSNKVAEATQPPSGRRS